MRLCWQVFNVQIEGTVVLIHDFVIQCNDVDMMLTKALLE
jgi:hypothetical protein